jgi:hypothetical protein
MAGRGGKQRVKSTQERVNYSKAIRAQDYEPTLNEQFNFYESDNLEDSQEITDVPQKRPVSFNERLKDYWDNNGIQTIIGILLVVVGFFVTFFLFDINKGITKIEVKQDQNIKSIDEVKKVGEENADKLNEMNLDIQKNSIKLEYLEKQVDKTQESGKQPVTKDK